MAAGQQRNRDLEMFCEDDELSASQKQLFVNYTTSIKAHEAQMTLFQETMKTILEESVELCVRNTFGAQHLNTKFTKSVNNTIVLNSPSTVAVPAAQPSFIQHSTAAGLPRIQSVTSLQQMAVPQHNIRYQVLNMPNTDANKMNVTQANKFQGVHYQIVTRDGVKVLVPQQQPVITPSTSQPIILPVTSVIVPTTTVNPPTAIKSTANVNNKVVVNTSKAVNYYTAKTPYNMTVPSSPRFDAENHPQSNDVTDSSGTIEPSYYGAKEGNSQLYQQKGNFSFKCFQCQITLLSNIAYIRHINEHLEKQCARNAKASGVVICEHCFKTFHKPQELENHKEKLHSNNGFKCKICELSFANKIMLTAHLEKQHKALQMPYACKLCGYMTSIYQDILHHFQVRHEGTRSLLCHLCLNVMPDVKTYYTHCLKHHTASNLSKGHCRMCKLIFLNSQDFKEHAEKDHVIHKPNSTTAIKRQLPSIPKQHFESPAKKKPKTQTTGTSACSSELIFSKCNPEVLGRLRCCECGAIANIQNHFQKYSLKCTQCVYQTYCQRSFVSHSNIFHSKQRSPPALHPVTKIYNRNRGSVSLKCQRCLFTTYSASFMAWHVVICPKGSSVVESFCYRKNMSTTTTTSTKAKKAIGNDDPIVIDDSDDEEENVKSSVASSSKNTSINGVH